MGKVTDRRLARGGHGWEADPIESGFDAPCHLCGEHWPVELMGLGEEGRTCAPCEADADRVVQARRFTHEFMGQVVLVNLPAVGLGMWLASGLVPAHTLFIAMVWVALCLGQAMRWLTQWRSTRGGTALVAVGAGLGSAFISVAGALVYLL